MFFYSNVSRKESKKYEVVKSFAFFLCLHIFLALWKDNRYAEASGRTHNKVILIGRWIARIRQNAIQMDENVCIYSFIEIE